MKNIILAILVLFGLSASAQVTIDSTRIKIDPNGLDSIFVHFTSYLGKPHRFTETSGPNPVASCNGTRVKHIYFKGNIQINPTKWDTSYIMNLSNFDPSLFGIILFQDTIWPYPILLPPNLPPFPITLLDTIINDSCLNIGTGVKGNELSEYELSLYPNPAANYFQLKGANKVSVDIIQLFDVNGKKVKQSELVNSTFDVSDLVNGVYFVQINSDKHSVVKKLIISR